MWSLSGHAYGGVGVGVETRGEPTLGVEPVGVLRGSRTLDFFFGPPRPMFIAVHDRGKWLH